MKCEGMEFVFSTGRRIHAGEGLIGIPIDGSNFIGIGYDRQIEANPPLTPDERRELAETMIAAWTRWHDTPDAQTYP